MNYTHEILDLLVSKEYRKWPKLSNKKKQYNYKLSKNLNRQFSKEDTQMVNMHI